MMYAGLGIALLAVILAVRSKAQMSGAEQSGGLTPTGSPATQPGWTIASVARAAGFTGGDLVTAIAIAYAESGGLPDAHGDQNITQIGRASCRERVEISEVG